MDRPVRSTGECSDDIKLAFEACLAEYNTVRKELLQRTEMHLKITEYGVLAMSAIITAITIMQRTSDFQVQIGMVSIHLHHVLLLLPFVPIYLQSALVDESIAVYIAQGYVIYVLRPNLKRILQECKKECRSENSSLSFEGIWEWDIFHIEARSGIAGAIAGSIRSVTFAIPIVIPIGSFIAIAIRQKGYLTVWEGGIIGFIIALILLLFHAMFCARGDIRKQALKYRREQEIVSAQSSVLFRD